MRGTGEGFAAWSPDGRQIACGGVSNGFQDFGLWILDSVGTPPMSVIRILNPVGAPPMQVIRGRVNRPAWSPDGSKLAFDFGPLSGGEIWMIETKSLAPMRAFHATHHPRGRPAHLDLKRPFLPRGKLVPLVLDSTGYRGLVRDKPAPLYLDAKGGRTLSLGSLGNPLDDLPDLPRGEQVLAGVKFHIGNHPIQLGNEYLPEMPDRVEGIAVHRAGARLYVLHASGYGDAYTGVPNSSPMAHYRPLPFRSSAIDAMPNRMTIGYYRVRYEDGSDQWIAFVEGQDLRDWCSFGGVSLIRGTVAWRVNNEVTEARATVPGIGLQPICLFVGGWQNPHPERRVTAIDYIAAGTTAAPFCVAITVEEPESK